MSSHHCHKLVKETAVGMAEVLYDELMTRNDWYKGWRDSHPGASPKGLRNAFVRKSWGTLVPQARAMLATMLGQPISDVLKDQIHEALILDRSLPGGQVASALGSPR